mgnify:CR=1 FL=1
MGEKKHGLRRVAGYFVNHRLLNAGQAISANFLLCRVWKVY